MMGPARENDLVELPQAGDRARLGRVVERFPHFWIAAGATGTVTEATENLIALRMDEHVHGAEEWNNELCWTADDGALYRGSAAEQIARAFYADAEIINSIGGQNMDSIGGTDEQKAAVEESKANFATNPEVELLKVGPLPADAFGEGFPDDALIVEFTYRHLDHDSGIPGREVTVFAADGDVLSSQDFG